MNEETTFEQLREIIATEFNADQLPHNPLLIGIEGVITFYGSGFSIEEATVALSSCVLNSSISYVMVTPITVHFLR